MTSGQLYLCLIIGCGKTQLKWEEEHSLLVASMPSLLFLAITITILQLPASLAEPGVQMFDVFVVNWESARLISPWTRRVDRCTSRQLGAWATCQASWRSSSSGRWTTLTRRWRRTDMNNWCPPKTPLPPYFYQCQEEQEEPLMPSALAARSSFPGSLANLHPVGNTANLPKWLVWQYLRLGWLGHQHPWVIDRPKSE